MAATCTTNGITVSVQTQYLAEHSNPLASKFTFTYEINIENGSPFTVQLLRRYWKITDSNGLVRTVDDVGVVGVQPLIAPNENFQYNSYCVFMTEIGRMYGKYQMMRQSDGVLFDVEIPAFQMVAPSKDN